MILPGDERLLGVVDYEADQEFLDRLREMAQTMEGTPRAKGRTREQLVLSCEPIVLEVALAKKHGLEMVDYRASRGDLRDPITDRTIDVKTQRSGTGWWEFTPGHLSTLKRDRSRVDLVVTGDFVRTGRMKYRCTYRQVISVRALFDDEGELRSDLCPLSGFDNKSRLGIRYYSHSEGERLGLSVSYEGSLR